MIPFVHLAASLVTSLPINDGSIDTADAAASRQDETSVDERLRLLEERNTELERRLGLLSEELEQTALGDAYTPVGEGFRGLSPAASKIYAASSPLSIGGYGEGVYENYQGGGTDRADLLRTVLYVGYRFNDKWLLNTEFELEHSSTAGNANGDNGSFSAEFAYLEYLATDEFSFRMGLLLVPIGFVNELHEPTLFPSADRPFLEQSIIPSTFRENGFGIAGENEDIAYRAYVMNGLDAQGFSATGLRGGRQRGAEALAEDLVITGRLDYVGFDDWTIGASLYHGNTGQGSDAGSIQTTLGDVHVEYQRDGWRGRFLGVMAELDDVAALNNELGLVGADSIGEELSGYYLEGQYDLFNESPDSGELLPFVRFEKFNTQERVPDTFSSDPANDREIWTFGMAYKPHPNLVFKADYSDLDNEAGTGLDIFRLSIGYVF